MTKNIFSFFRVSSIFVVFLFLFLGSNTGCNSTVEEVEEVEIEASVKDQIQQDPTSIYPENQNVSVSINQMNRLSEKAEEAKSYVQNKNFYDRYAILVDMSLHSGKNRMFIYDLKYDRIADYGLSSHGCGHTYPWSEDASKENPSFSNVSGSRLSSLGKYKIGIKSPSQWGIGIHYKLHGLEATNNKAYQRVIVLHSWNLIPNNELYPAGTPEGWGCPAVSNDFMHRLDDFFTQTDKPVLFWMFQ